VHQQFIRRSHCKSENRRSQGYNPTQLQNIFLKLYCSEYLVLEHFENFLNGMDVVGAMHCPFLYSLGVGHHKLALAKSKFLLTALTMQLALYLLPLIADRLSW
jgi:hypothetical protein